jgi:hypothetical protein
VNFTTVKKVEGQIYVKLAAISDTSFKRGLVQCVNALQQIGNTLSDYDNAI